MEKRKINTTEIRDLDEKRYLLHTGEIVKRSECEVTYEHTDLDWENQELEITEL